MAVWQSRLEHARRMLRSAASIGIPVGDIALESGFTDLASFSRMFKRRYGATPSEMRDRHVMVP